MLRTTLLSSCENMRTFSCKVDRPSPSMSSWARYDVTIGLTSFIATKADKRKRTSDTELSSWGLALAA